MITYKVCIDCIMAIANNDFTGLDYHYSEDEASTRMDEIKQGMAELGANIVCMDEGTDEFCVMPCDCCGSKLAGERHYVADITDSLGE